MKFFNVNRTKQVIGNIADNAWRGLVVSMPFVAVYGIYKDEQKKIEVFGKYNIDSKNPNSRYRYDHDTITCRGVTGNINGRIVDTDTGEAVARCP